MKLLSGSRRSAGMHLIMIVTPGPLVVPFIKLYFKQDFMPLHKNCTNFKSVSFFAQNCKIICTTETGLEDSLYSACVFPDRHSVLHVVSHRSEFSFA